jgi:cell division protein ZapA
VKASHTVRVLGREISVRSTAPAAKVKDVEAFVNTSLQEIGAALKSGDAQLVLTLALLNTAEELLELRKAHEADAFLEGRLREMLQKLESV